MLFCPTDCKLMLTAKIYKLPTNKATKGLRMDFYDLSNKEIADYLHTIYRIYKSDCDAAAEKLMLNKRSTKQRDELRYNQYRFNDFVRMCEHIGLYFDD